MPLPPEKTPIAAPQQPKAPFDMEMMDTVRQAQGQGPAGQMNSLQIIKKAIEPQLASGLDWDDFQRRLVGWIRTRNNKLLQIGNTVFLLTFLSPEVCQFSILNADSEANLLQNISGLSKALKNHNFKKMIAYANEPKYVELAKKTKLPVKIGQSQKVVNGEAIPVYTFEMDV